MATVAKDRILAKEARTTCVSRGRDGEARVGREAAGSENEMMSSWMKGWDEKRLGVDVVQDQSHTRGGRRGTGWASGYRNQQLCPSRCVSRGSNRYSAALEYWESRLVQDWKQRGGIVFDAGKILGEQGRDVQHRGNFISHACTVRAPPPSFLAWIFFL